jgi:hypothetical protein
MSTIAQEPRILPPPPPAAEPRENYLNAATGVLSWR